MMDRLTSMAVFVKAADLGSFAAAAVALGLSPQMVAKHVVFLEDHLGTRLLNRTTRRQSLTEFGEAYRDTCRHLLAEVEAAESLAHAVRTRPRGRLRVNAPVTFGTQSLIPLVTGYLRAQPEVRLDLTLSDRMVDLVEEGYEAVIRIGPLAESGLIARRLAPYRLIACAAPAYLAERGTPAVPADLASHECLGFSHWSGALAGAWRFTRNGRIFDVAVTGRLRVNDWKALLQAALEGFGVTLGAEMALQSELASGRLIRILQDYAAPSRPMHLLYAADRHPTPKLRSFIDAVVAEFGAEA